MNLNVDGMGILAGLARGVAASRIFRSQFYGIHRLEWCVLVPVAPDMIRSPRVVADSPE